MRWTMENFSARYPIFLDGSATAAATKDATISITPADQWLWSKIQDDGDDIRIANASGLSRIDYDLESFSYANEVVTIELSGVVHHVTNTGTIVWAYVGDSTATNEEDGITTSSPLVGYTLNTGPAPGEPIFTLANPLGETVPGQNMRKRSTETVFAWFQIGPLGTLSMPYNGRLFGEGPQSLSSAATVVAGGSGTLTAATSAVRVWQADNGALLCRVTLSGGADANSYDLVLSVVTTEGRTLQGIVRVEVND